MRTQLTTNAPPTLKPSEIGATQRQIEENYRRLAKKYGWRTSYKKGKR